jgi:hypothetical protein
MASPQITTAEIRNLRHRTGELAGICSLETTIRQFGIIFPAINQAAKVLQNKTKLQNKKN